MILQIGTAGTTGALSFFGTLGTALATANPTPLLIEGGALGASALAAKLVSRDMAGPTARFARSLSEFYRGKAGQTPVKAASIELSRTLAQKFGADPIRLNAAINQQFGLSPVSPADHLNHIENNLSPEQRPAARRQVFEQSMAP